VATSIPTGARGSIRPPGPRGRSPPASSTSGATGAAAATRGPTPRLPCGPTPAGSRSRRAQIV